jgi:hypothetical protein
MKPTPQVNPSQYALRSFPLTDYSFQSTLEAPVISASTHPETKSRAFHKMSSDYLGAETQRDYVAELFFFLLITGMATWPIMSMLACLAWMRIVF